MTLLSILLGVLAFIAAIVVLLFLKFIVRPYIRIQYYRKQGANTCFFPMIGRFKDMIADFEKHGDLYYGNKRASRDNPDRFFCSNLASDAYISLHDTALVKEFYSKTDCYVKEQLTLDLFIYILGNGLVMAEGNEWRAQKKMLSKNFHFDFLNTFLPKIQQIANQNLAALRENSLKNMHLMNEMQHISGEIVGKMFFGDELDTFKFEGRPLTRSLCDLIAESFNVGATAERHILGLWLTQFVPKHRKMIKKINAFRKTCAGFISDRRKRTPAENESKDMLQILLDYSKAEGELSDMQLVDQFLSFFVPGLDTSGHLLGMSIYMLTIHPEEKAKVWEEIKQHYTPGKPTTVEQLGEMKYLTAVLKETLRMYSPLNDIFPRKAIKDHMLKDIHIRKGDIVNVDFFYNTYNLAYFDDPETFKPSRWLETKNLDAFAFTPFSAGPRTCIGQHLAMNETKVILSEFFHMYDAELNGDYTLRMTLGFVYEPAESIFLNLTSK